MNSQMKNKATNGRLPSFYTQTLIKAEFDYRREMRRKLEQIQQDNRDCVRRRIASGHIFSKVLLTKRHQWFSIDKSYRDACRTTWSRQAAERGRTSHVFLPSVYSENPSPLTMASLTTTGGYDENENPAVTDERIKQNFLHLHPVMIEIARAPHTSKSLRFKHEVELRKKSAQKRQVHIQTTARTDDRYTQLVSSLQEV